jgi:hypothetical protein
MYPLPLCTTGSRNLKHLRGARKIVIFLDHLIEYWARFRDRAQPEVV